MTSASASVRGNNRTNGSHHTNGTHGETPRARGERTRGRVADALVELLSEGDPAPTAKSVAARAGVSVRLVFHHFEDMETLYRAALEAQVDRYWSPVRSVEPDLPLDERIERTIQQRARLFDTVGPIQRAVSALPVHRDDLSAAVARTDGLQRQWVQATFGPELGRSGRQRKELLDALDAAASFEAWDRLRRVQGLSVPAARRTMARTVSSLLSD